MSIPYAPYIADTIPGFVTTSVKIPFTMNPAVSWEEIYGFKLQIKEYNRTNVIATSTWVKDSQPEPNELTFTTFNTSSGVTFPIVGQYYKFQLGYMTQSGDTNIVYSSASIGKCVGRQNNFSVFVNGINNNSSTNKGVYIGSVTTPDNEPVYSYRFTCGNQDTGEILYTSNNSYKFKVDHEITDTENLQFSITTVNGYKKDSQVYNITEYNGSDLGNEHSIAHITDEPEEEKGYIKIQTKHTILPGSSKYFLLERTTDQQNYEELVQYSADSTHTTFVWRDCSIEAGQYYYYSIREVDSIGQFLSNRKFIINNENQPLPISINYEDIFLTDLTGKQLCIKFDPKVSSFKDTIQETKIETIGSQYPFFFRNGQIKYKEIPISGLISYNMDESFMTDAELGFPFTRVSAAAGRKKQTGQIVSETETIGRSTQLTGVNFAAERKFKLKVMEWLNDGTPKLFRSPAEGVYVIRLMNVSLSPNDTLGRMLHSFSATGYEVSDADLEKLKDAGFINFPEESYARSSRLGWFVLGFSELGGSA